MTTLSPTKMTTTTPATLTAFRVRVVWDTQEEVPEFVCFPADVAEKISAEINDLVGDDEDEREEWTDHCVVKHLEATTGWLVSSWKMAEDEETETETEEDEEEEEGHVDAEDYLAYLEEMKADAVGEDVAKIEEKIEAWKKIAVWDV
jgi:hypothetical protein